MKETNIGGTLCIHVLNIHVQFKYLQPSHLLRYCRSGSTLRPPPGGLVFIEAIQSALLLLPSWQQQCEDKATLANTSIQEKLTLYSRAISGWKIYDDSALNAKFQESALQQLNDLAATLLNKNAKAVQDYGEAVQQGRERLGNLERQVSACSYESTDFRFLQERANELTASARNIRDFGKVVCRQWIFGKEQCEAFMSNIYDELLKSAKNQRPRETSLSENASLSFRI